MGMMRELLKSAAYGGLELLTLRRGLTRVIGAEAIRFPPRWSRYYPGNYEPETFRFLAEYCRPGQTAMDIGAHLGLFSVVMARRVGGTGKVFSFEPTDATRSVLTRVISLNGFGSIVEVRSEAVSGCCGTVPFHQTPEIVSNANSIVRTGRTVRHVTVPTTTVDTFLAERCMRVDCLKIDAEGAELEILRGAECTLRECRPSLCLSLHPALLQQMHGSLPEVWDLLRGQNMVVACEGQAVDRAWFCGKSELFDVHVFPAGAA